MFPLVFTNIDLASAKSVRNAFDAIESTYALGFITCGETLAYYIDLRSELEDYALEASAIYREEIYPTYAALQNEIHGLLSGNVKPIEREAAKITVTLESDENAPAMNLPAYFDIY